MLSAADRVLGQPSDAIVAAADPAAADAVALRRAVARPYAPDLVIASVAGATEGWPIFSDKLPRDGRPTAYVCRGYACEAPTDNPATAARQVERMTQVG
jgi:uncharacterized protein YyaL (SSP411 family)